MSSSATDGLDCSIGRWQSLHTGLFMIPSLVLMETTRTHPSSPACNVIMRPILHCNGGRRSSLMMTKSPIFKFSLLRLHFDLCCKRDKYSVFHLFQKCWNNRCVSGHLECLLSFEVVKSCSGMDFKGPPTRKCPGVSADRSFGSLDNGDMGLEFRQASTWTIIVYIVLRRLGERSLQMLFNCFYMPPICGAPAGLKFHSIPSFTRWREICSLWSLDRMKL